MEEPKKYIHTDEYEKLSPAEKSKYNYGNGLGVLKETTRQSYNKMSQDEKDQYQQKMSKEQENVSKPKLDPDKFAKGAGNQLLFGIPAAVIRKTGLPGYSSDQANIDIDKLEQDPSYQSGEMAGSVGSGFIPIAGIAGKVTQAVKGGVKVAEAAAHTSRLQKLLRPLAEAQKIESIASKTLPGALKTNIINSVAGEGIREAAKGELDAEKLLTAGAFGAGGTLLGKGVGTVAGRLAQKLSGGSQKAVSEIADGYLKAGSARPSDKIVNAAKDKLTTFGPLNPHQESLMDPAISKIQSAAGQASAADSWMVNAAHVADKYGIKPGSGASIDAAIAANAKKYSQLDELTTPLVPKLQEKFASPEMAEKAANIMKSIPSSKSEITNVVMKNYNDIIQDLTQAQTPQAMREAINGHLGVFYKQLGGASDQNAVDSSIKIAKMLRNELGADFAEAATAAGKPHLAATPMEHGVIEDIGKQMLMKQFAGQGGSTIPLSQAIGNFVTGNSNVRSLAAAGIGQTIGRAPANAIKQWTQNKTGNRFAQLMQKEGAPISTVESELGNLGKAPAPAGEVLVKDPSKLSQGLGKAAGVIEDQAVTHGGSAVAGAEMAKQKAGGDTPLMTDQTLVAGSTNPQGSQSAMQDRLHTALESRAQEIWKTQYLDKTYGPASLDNDNYKFFVDDLKNELKGPDGNELDPRIMGSILLVNEADKKAFGPAYDAYRSIFPNIRAAFGSAKGLPIVNETVGQVPLLGDLAKEGNLQVARAQNQVSQDQEAKAARASIIAGIRTAAEYGGKNPEDAAHSAEQIISTSASPAEMEQKLLQYLATVNSSAYTILKKTGILP